jgi:hypothetical protein
MAVKRKEKRTVYVGMEWEEEPLFLDGGTFEPARVFRKRKDAERWCNKQPHSGWRYYAEAKEWR